jgi:predicted phosphodiesterase
VKVFVISDTHFPFNSKKAYAKVLGFIKEERPDAVVQIGDLLDQYMFSKYGKSPKFTPEQDIVKGLADAKSMWATIAKFVPKAKLYQILGNHDVRISKRISEVLPALSSIYSPLALYDFPGVKVMKSDRDYLVLDKVVYCHGWLSKSIDHAKHFNQPTVHGHRHRPTVEVDGPLWSMDVGYLADDKTLPLSYTASKFSRWRKACGVVEDGLPRLILL